MKSNTCTSTGVAMGAVFGAVVGVALTLYLVPKTAGRLAEDLTQLAEGLQEKTADLIQSANIPDEKAILEYAENNSSLLVGALGGAVLGIAAALYSGKEDKYEAVKESLQSGNDWSQIVQTLTEEFQEMKQKGEKSFYKVIEELLQSVSSGLQALEKK